MKQSILYCVPKQETAECALLRRPSCENKSPYVADVNKNDTTHLAHVPSLNLSGKCVPGTICLMKYATDKKGNKIGPDCITPKYGKRKCEFHSFLVLYKSVWIAAHPKIGETIAALLLKPGTIYNSISMSEISKCQAEVTGVAGTNMRVDFLLTHKDGSYTMVEVKSVVDCESDDPNSCIETTGGAIFPYGKRTQKHNGVKVVSERAIKHVSELTLVSKKIKTDTQYPILNTCVLFIVVRGDCTYFKPHKEACPAFATVLHTAKENGVLLVAHKVGWEINQEQILCTDHGEIPILLP